jgi:endoglucanase
MTDGSAGPPAIGAAQLALLERLCNAAGVSGYENEVRAIVLEQVRPLADDVQVDALGNVLAVRRGQEDAAPADRPRLRVMAAAHMDEVGLMLTDEESPGIFRFENVHSNPRCLIGKPVRVGREHIPGVIGFPPIHLLEGQDNSRFPDADDLRVDVGSNEGGRVRPGDCAVFGTPFARMGAGVRAKALDDRLGVATLIEMLRHAPPNIDLLAAFTVQEEIGLRGAGAAAFRLDPDLAVALDCTPALDLPALNGQENTRYNTRTGCGPAIYTADRGTLSDPRLIRWLRRTAEDHGLPYQMRQPGGGGTDAGAIHKARGGIPSVSLSVPGRYMHTPASYVRLDDWEHTLRLAHAALSGLTRAVLDAER